MKESSVELKVDFTEPLEASAYAFLSNRKLNRSDLSDYSKEELKILRNAIFAMHGRVFKSADLREYFGNCSWYEPRFENVDDDLTQIERANITLIKSLE